jgi:outer membrane protein OmpA-like peptidoglycan-associated protein
MKRLLFALTCLLLAGCATKGTSVVLLEDPDGSVGKVEVSTPAGEQTLSRAGETTSVKGPSAAPSKVRVMNRKKIDRTYGRTLNALPEPVETFLIYFKSGTTTLAPNSLSTPRTVVESIARRSSGDVRINGHSDRVGSRHENELLSQARAAAVRDILIEQGVAPEILRIFSHGEGNPLVPTPDGVPEPRNRRVEVLVR